MAGVDRFSMGEVACANVLNADEASFGVYTERDVPVFGTRTATKLPLMFPEPPRYLVRWCICPRPAERHHRGVVNAIKRRVRNPPMRIERVGAFRNAVAPEIETSFECSYQGRGVSAVESNVSVLLISRVSVQRSGLTCGGSLLPGRSLSHSAALSSTAARVGVGAALLASVRGAISPST